MTLQCMTIREDMCCATSSEVRQQSTARSTADSHLQETLILQIKSRHDDAEENIADCSDQGRVNSSTNKGEEEEKKKQEKREQVEKEKEKVEQEKAENE